MKPYTPVHQGKLTWICQGVSVYESDWMAQHRFCWLNDLPNDSVRIQRILISLKNSSGFVLWKRNGRSILGSNEVFIIGKRKFCSLCIAHCFDSPLFDIEAVVACPHHHVPLTDRCPHCKSTSPFSSTGSADGARPLRYSCCGTWFTTIEPTVDAPSRLSLRAARSFEIATRRVSRIAKLDRFGFLDAPDLNKTAYFNAAYKIVNGPCLPTWASGCEVSLTRFDDPPDELHPTPSEVRREIRRQIFHGRTWIRRSDVALLLMPCLDEIAAIDHRLRLQIKRICGHHCAPQLRLGRIIFQNPGLEVHPSSCPCCTCYQLWKATMGRNFALYQLALEQQDIYWWRDDILKEIFYWMKISNTQLKAIADSAFIRLSVELCDEVKAINGVVDTGPGSKFNWANGITGRNRYLKPVDFRGILVVDLPGSWPPKGYLYQEEKRYFWRVNDDPERGFSALRYLLHITRGGAMWPVNKAARSYGALYEQDDWYQTVWRRACGRAWLFKSTQRPKEHLIAEIDTGRLLASGSQL